MLDLDGHRVVAVSHEAPIHLVRYILEVVGLLAGGATPAQAACWATHVHASAGERLGTRISHVGFLARELLDEAPLVLAELTG
ncbi:MAG: hypothetical protein EKK42_02840 [Pseudonocardiaceae bacterium]|nr:MAG: hypothetical protein EKK42_02840 [Pseudonocardiaceae bacterium]